jgi:Ran-binding protein 3
MTGEEEEETLHQVRGKLFSLVDGTQWKERGTGTIKLNVRRSDGGGARLGAFIFTAALPCPYSHWPTVMRKEAVYTVLLNVTLFHGMRCTLAQDPRYIRLSVLEGGAATHYNLRVSHFYLVCYTVFKPCYFSFAGHQCEGGARTAARNQCESSRRIT